MLARWVLADVCGELLTQPPRGHAFEGVDQPGQGHVGWVVHEQVHMVGVAVELAQLRAETLAHLVHDLLVAGQYLVGECATPVLRDKDQMGMEVVYDATSPAYIAVWLPSW